MKPIILEDNPFISCEITSNAEQTQFTGALTYRGAENGTIVGGALEDVRNQYRSLCSLSENEGAMLRRGSVMLGYHNDLNKGDVLLLYGEVIGRWEMEEDNDLSHFFTDGQTEPAFSAPSAWMLHDAIANWLERETSIAEIKS